MTVGLSSYSCTHTSLMMNRKKKKIDYVNSKNPLDISLDDRTGCI
jgi:hypothetical protein